jgi:hypothetical protein
VKNFLRSGFVNRPLPSARLVAIESRTVQLINEKVIATGKGFRAGGNSVREINGLLVDQKVFEHESHVDIRKS